MYAIGINRSEMLVLGLSAVNSPRCGKWNELSPLRQITTPVRIAATTQ